jgi:hypothetical protein
LDQVSVFVPLCRLSEVVNSNSGYLLKNMNLISYMGSRRVQVRESGIMCLNEVPEAQGAQVTGMNLR